MRVINWRKAAHIIVRRDGPTLIQGISGRVIVTAPFFLLKRSRGEVLLDVPSLHSEMEFLDLRLPEFL